MKQEDRELLLKDLSARLPYGVICTGKYIEFDDNDNLIFIDATGELTQVHFTKNCCYLNVGLMHECKLETVKPYLRPMSSMTEEELKEYSKVSNSEDAGMWTDLDWLNEHHFDYRGLIEKGLAIAVKEENNPYK